VGAYQGAKTCWEGAWRPEYRCLMNGTHGNQDSCHPDGGATLRQTNFCNWCRELVAMRIFHDIGFLSRTNAFQDWTTNYRAKYWAQFPVKLPDRGLPLKDTCGAPVTHQDPQ
jgi:hypothetical protein